MGNTSWSNDLYRDRVDHRARTGTPTFVHDANVRSGRTAAAAHPTLSPKSITVREARDSDAHPNSLAISIFFDVTGSMGRVPRRLQQKLTKLMETLLDKKYCEDPQIMVGAVGDYNAGDRVPLQVGQFESGIEIDEQLGLIYIEEGGGGSFEESYQNALYLLARKTATDCWEQRGKKGFAFLIGDEKPYGASTVKEIEDIFGDKISENVTIHTLIREVQERYHLFFIIPNNTSYYNNPELHATWAGLIGTENVIKLEDPDLVCETIGATIGMFENSLSIDDVASVGDNAADALVIRGALDKLANSASVQAASEGVPAAKDVGDDNVRL
jgi:hypothetical protein